jgi:GNAT superfamily N-acetyltransferase
VRALIVTSSAFASRLLRASAEASKDLLTKCQKSLVYHLQRHHHLSHHLLIIHLSSSQPSTFTMMPLISAMLLLFLVIASPLVFSLSPNVQYRGGIKSDEQTIATTMAKQLMNPLGVKSERFIVATTADNDRPIGWAQIRPLGTAQRDPGKYNSKPGSFDVEREADERMWEEFEDDETCKVPVGLASLPWTKEYRAFEEAARKRRERREAIIEREKARAPMLYELASVFVQPEYRGMGIGTELIQRVLQRHVNRGRALSDVYLLTLATTVAWYYNFGFEVIPEDEVPAQMAFEIAAGKLITRLIGAKLCCMRGNSNDSK